MLKKFIVIVIVMLFVSPSCFAQSREELVKRHNEITVEINQLKEAIAKSQMRQMEIIGVLKYLKAQEKSKPNSAVKNFPQGK